MSVNAANGVDYPRSPSSVQSFAVTAGTSSSSTSVVEPQHLLHLQQHQQPVTSSHFIRSSEVALAVAVPPDGVHQQAALSSTGEASGKVKNKKRVPKYRATKRPPSDRRFQCDHCDSKSIVWYSFLLTHQFTVLSLIRSILHSEGCEASSGRTHGCSQLCLPILYTEVRPERSSSASRQEES